MSAMSLKARLVKQAMRFRVISALQALLLTYKLGVVPRDLYDLFMKYKPLQKDAREFLEGYLEEVSEEC